MKVYKNTEMTGVVKSLEHTSQTVDTLDDKFGHKGVNCVDYAITIHHLPK